MLISSWLSSLQSTLQRRSRTATRRSRKLASSQHVASESLEVRVLPTLVVQFDASTLALANNTVVSSWGGQTAAGTPTYFTGQTPSGGAAVQFNAGGDRMGDNISVLPSAAGDWIVAAVVKANSIGTYHNLVDDDAQNRPMLWIDGSFNYEMNGGGGTGAKQVGAGTGGWDIVIGDSKSNQLYVNSATPNATGGGAMPFTVAETFDFFHRDGGQTFQGLVAEERIYTDRADFNNDFVALYNSLRSKWFGANTAPTATVNTPASVTVNEGSPASIAGTWSDADAGNTVSLTASLGTITKSGTNAAGTWIWSYTPAEEAAAQTVTITANDGTISTTTTFSLTVNDAPLTAGALTPPGNTGSPAISSFVTSGLTNPHGLAFDAAGNLYVASYQANKISKVTPAGVVSDYVTGLTGPFWSAFDASGNLYISGSNITKVTPGGVRTTFATSAQGLNTPNGMAFDASGNMYVANGGNHTISKITFSSPGVFGSATIFANNTGMDDPDGLAFDSSGNLYVTNYSNSTVSKITPAGVFSTFISSGLVNPVGIVFDATGNMYVSNIGSNSILKITFSAPGVLGTSSTFVNTSGPAGLVFDATGAMYVANYTGNAISKITVPSLLLKEGQAFTNTTVFHFTDADPAGTASDYTAVVTLGDGNTVTLNSSGKVSGPAAANGQIVASAGGGFDVKLSYTYADNLSNATFSVVVTDHSATASRTTATFSVANLAPTASFHAPTLIVYGNSVNVSLTDSADASTIDSGSLHYAFGYASTNSSPLTAVAYVGSGTTTSDSFASLNAGSYWVFSRVIDKDNGYTEYSQQVTVDKASATVTVNGYSGTYDASAHGATGTVVGVAGDLAASGSSLSLGSSFTNAPGGTANWSFTGGTNYNDQNGTADIVINKANQTITWSNPAAINYGTPLSGTQLNATVAGVAGGTAVGVLTYSPSDGTVLLAGTQTLMVSAAATTNYNLATASVSLVVNPYTSAGFLQPISPNRAFKQGSTVSIKWRVNDASGNPLTSLSAIANLTVTGPGGTTQLYPGNNNSSGATVLRNDDGQYIFNWQTKGFVIGSYTISALLADGTSVTQTIMLSKSGAASGLVINGVTGTTAVGALLAGDLTLYVNNSSGGFSSDELARIDAAIAGIELLVSPYGANIFVVDGSVGSNANIVLASGTTSVLGGMAEGILGVSTSDGGITIIDGWNWYAGASAGAIGSSQYDFQTVITHEIAHSIGLGHSDTASSVMFPALATRDARRALVFADLNTAGEEGGAGLHVEALFAASHSQNVASAGQDSTPLSPARNLNLAGPAGFAATPLRSIVKELTIDKSLNVATTDVSNRRDLTSGLKRLAKESAWRSAIGSSEVETLTDGQDIDNFFASLTDNEGDMLDNLMDIAFSELGN